MGLFHKHKFVEQYGGLYADEEGGPRTYHELWNECACGAFSSEGSRAAHERAAWAKRQNIVAIIPQRYIRQGDVVVPPNVPKGWALVPKEATMAMVRAGYDANPNSINMKAASVYKAMVAAAPVILKTG